MAEDTRSRTRSPRPRRRNTQFRATTYLPLALSLVGYAAPLLTGRPAAPAVARAAEVSPRPSRTAEVAVDDFTGTPPPAVASQGYPPAMKAHFIDVGQGAATLFEFSCGTVLVDTGGETDGEFDSGNALKNYLDTFFDGRRDLNRTIDLLVISHPHIDHARNARMVAEEYTVKNVVTDGLTSSSGGRQQKWLQEWAKANAHLETVEADKLPAGGKTSAVIDPIKCADEDPRLKVLWGAVTAKPAEWTQADMDNANNQSVVLRIDFGTASFLMSGDLEVEGISELLARQNPKALDVDVWEVSHHGSYNGINKALLDAITPSIALMATGPDTRHELWTAWAYGHPRKQAMDLLLQALQAARKPVDKKVATKVKVFEEEQIDRAAFATGWDGSVVVTATNQGKYWVETEK